MSHDVQGPEQTRFTDLALDDALLKALDASGYTAPTPIQAKMIPQVMAGRDVVGQAQTGTGKTAAFALPLLSSLRLQKKARPEVLVLAPTRELAIQVAEAFQNYGRYLSHLRVLAVYGGADYASQLRELERGVQVVVGTPGRVMDHIRRGSLNLAALRSLVLDEADEMLKMGFLDDVEWILAQTPAEKQVALFSATMPDSIRRIAATYLREPVEITIKEKSIAASTIEQRYLLVRSLVEKREALERILEVERFDGMLVFVRTKAQTVELAEHLAALGYGAGALNGDISQVLRLRMVEQLKAGKLDILVATDVAARGLDVERVSHVVNFDVPFDTEAYIHRIGRTGRAGRSGKAILFLQTREKAKLKAIERATGGRIAQTSLPSVADINQRRVETYTNRITEALSGDCSFFSRLVEDYCREHDAPLDRVAAALAKMAQGNTPLLLSEREPRQQGNRPALQKRGEPKTMKSRRRGKNREAENTRPEEGMDRYRIAVGETHGVKPGNIVGAIANEADIDSAYIGRISIYNDYSTVDLPYGMPKPVLRLLQKARINGKKMQMRRDESASA